MNKRSAARLAGRLILVLVCLSFAACEDDNGTRYTCYTAGPEEHAVYIRDYNYLRYRFFDLGVVRNPDADTLIRFLESGDEIIRFELFEFSGVETDQPGVAHAYWPNPEDEVFKNYKVTSKFKRVSFPDDYNIKAEGLYLYFPRPRTNIENLILAYYVEYWRDGIVDTIGNLASDTLQLQLLKRSNPMPADPLWVAEWKNVYDLGIRGIDYENFDLDIYRGFMGTEDKEINFNHQNTVPYLQLFGLDQMDQSGNIGNPDGKIDNNDAILDFATWLLVFPDRRPFDTYAGYAINDPDSVLNVRVPAIYDSGDPVERRNASQYYLELRTHIRSTTFFLGHMNILPESEVVTFNGRRLNRDSDYDVDYELGLIAFLRDEVLDPNGQLDICYEYCP